MDTLSYTDEPAQPSPGMPPEAAQGALCEGKLTVRVTSPLMRLVMELAISLS